MDLAFSQAISSALLVIGFGAGVTGGDEVVFVSGFSSGDFRVVSGLGVSFPEVLTTAVSYTHLTLPTKA